MKNPYDIVQIINVHVHSTGIHMCLKLDVSNTIALHIGKTRKYGCQKHYCDISKIISINMHITYMQVYAKILSF